MVLYSNQYYHSWVQAGEETLLDRHVWQGLAIVVLIALVIFGINASPPIGNGNGLGITTTQAKKKAHQPLNLLDQRTAILAGLDINSNWIRKQNAADSLIYGTVKPDDTVPARTNEDYSYLITSNCDREISLFFKADKRRVTIKYANRDEKLHTKTVPLSRLVE